MISIKKQIRCLWSDLILTILENPFCGACVLLNCFLHLNRVNLLTELVSHVIRYTNKIVNRKDHQWEKKVAYLYTIKWSSKLIVEDKGIIIIDISAFRNLQEQFYYWKEIVSDGQEKENEYSLFEGPEPFHTRGTAKSSSALYPRYL